jgi:hypothetical protein
MHHAPPDDLLLKDAKAVGLMWYFFGLHKGYATLIAFSEIIPAIMILFKRTRFLGAILYLVTATNILAVNVFFGLTPYTLALSIILFINCWIIFYSERQKIKVLFSK